MHVLQSCWLDGWLAGSLAGGLAGWVAGWLARREAGWVACWLAGWMAGLLVVYPVGCLPALQLGWLEGSRVGWLPVSLTRRLSGWSPLFAAEANITEQVSVRAQSCANQCIARYFVYYNLKNNYCCRPPQLNGHISVTL